MNKSTNHSKAKLNKAKGKGFAGRQMHPAIAQILVARNTIGEGKFSEREASLARSVIQSSTTQKHFTVWLGYVQVITSSVGAVIQTVTPDSSVSSAPHFSQLSGIFDEFRVTEVHCLVDSYNKYSKTTTVSGPIFMVHDESDSTALGSTAQSAAIGNVVVSNTDDMFPDRYGYGHRYPKEHTSALNSWQPTSGNTLVGSLKWWSTGISASVTYGTAIIRYKTEFRFLTD